MKICTAENNPLYGTPFAHICSKQCRYYATRGQYLIESQSGQAPFSEFVSTKLPQTNFKPLVRFPLLHAYMPACHRKEGRVMNSDRKEGLVMNSHRKEGRVMNSHT